MKKSPLGRGLDALLTDNSTAKPEIISVRLSQVSPNRDQPRKYFDDSALEELAESIRQHGLIQPLLVAEQGAGYMIVAGERRWRAARMAGLEDIPVIICDYDRQQIAEVALVENLQREDLNPVEEAQGYRKLMDAFGLTQEAVSRRVGKPRSTVANALRILNLPPSVLQLIQDGKLSGGHAKVLASVENEKLLIEAAKKAVQQGMTVRELERLLNETAAKPKKEYTSPARDNFYDEFELAMNRELGRRVRVVGVPKGKKSGKIELEFFSNDDLVALSKILSKING